jgi:hypothetical protein
VAVMNRPLPTLVLVLKDVAMVAFAGQVGSPGAAGTLLALVAAGSLLAGLIYVTRS